MTRALIVLLVVAVLVLAVYAGMLRWRLARVCRQRSEQRARADHLAETLTVAALDAQLDAAAADLANLNTKPWPTNPSYPPDRRRPPS